MNCDPRKQGIVFISSERSKPERSHPMGDKKGKKDKAKGQKQNEAKQAKAEKQKQDNRKPRTA
jgi:hypothetical protein